jgi:TetR/AcrR family transcriptional regulator
MEPNDKEILSRKDRERERHRQEILEAAERAFTRDGYHGTTIESIAKEAEFAVGTIYNFFKGKDDLYGAVIFKIAGEFMERMERDVLPIEDPAEAIGAVFDVRLELDEKHGNFFRVLFEGGPRGSDDLHEKMRAFFDGYLAALSKIVERGIKSGSFNHEDPLYVALVIHGLCSAMTIYTAMKGSGTSTKDLAERTKAGFLAQLRRA